MNRINPASKWAKLSRWQKRLHGFTIYFIALFTCLIHPEATDSAVYNSIKNQFYNNGDVPLAPSCDACHHPLASPFDDCPKCGERYGRELN